ncbi:hypothetical protein [Pseudoxanthomonas putridarboris]|uniref:Uncharacterized protein n=1 Tax=Pseudoxanthomonas putridarboris TaxID=752605 RepID=A0ABU9IVY6_9GAMM
MSPAQIYDFQDYRRRQALRDCGAASQRREFLWMNPLNGSVSVGVFRPARSDAAESLRYHAGRTGQG